MLNCLDINPEIFFSSSTHAKLRESLTVVFNTNQGCQIYRTWQASTHEIDALENTLNDLVLILFFTCLLFVNVMCGWNQYLTTILKLENAAKSCGFIHFSSKIPSDMRLLVWCF